MRDIIKYFILFGWLWDWKEFKYVDTPLKILAIVINLIIAVAVILILVLFAGLLFANQASPLMAPTPNADEAICRWVGDSSVYLNGHNYACTDCDTAPITTTATVTATPTVLPMATPIVLDGLFPETKIINSYTEGEKTVLIIAIPNKDLFTLPILCGNNPAKVKSLMTYLIKYGPSIVDGKITFTLDIYQNAIGRITYRWQRPDGISEYDSWGCGEQISP